VAPNGIPKFPDGGFTEAHNNWRKSLFAKVTVYAYGFGSERTISDENRLNVCYHEARHWFAWGKATHLGGFDKVMNPSA
jgi:hypothetical protein